MANSNYVTVTSDKKKWVAFWLCLFGGWFGLHEFYVGKPFVGFLYLLTFGGFFKCYWWDLPRILRGKFKDNTGTYLRA